MYNSLESEQECFTTNNKYYIIVCILTILFGAGSYVTYYFTSHHRMIGILIILGVTYFVSLLYFIPKKNKDCQILTLNFSFYCIMFGYSLGISYIISDEKND